MEIFTDVKISFLLLISLPDRSWDCGERVVRSFKWLLKDFARIYFTENLENVILQSLLARFTLLLIKWMEYNIKRSS